LINFVLALYLIFISGLLFYTTHAYLMIYYYFWGNRNVKRKRRKIEEYPVVTVQLPIYNERYVVERLVRSVCGLKYPKDKLEIQVLDDSTDDTTEILKSLVEEYRGKGFDIKLLHRDEREGYKAGALREGLKTAKGEYVAIFDADFIVPSDFLLRTLPYFTEGVAAVQGRWGHINDKYSPVTQAQAVALDGHFYIEQQVRNKNGFFIIFNGTGGIWLKRAIYDAGNWHTDSLTEDLDLSYRAQLRGWKIIFLPDLVCPSEVPVDINGFKAQQYRWAKGTVQSAKKLLKRVFSSPLRPAIKYEAFIHLTNHFAYPMLLGLAILLLPLLIIKIQFEYRTYFIIASFFTIAVFAYPIMYSIAQRALYPDWKRRSLYILFILAFGMGLSVSLTCAVFEGLLGKPSEFVRTPKFGIEKKTDTLRKKRYRHKLTASTFAELIMTLYLLGTTFYAIETWQLLLVPFLLLYTVGFGYLSFGSIYQVWLERWTAFQVEYGRPQAA